jgi:nucleotide-binding universal stress UspA family protein
VNTILATVDLEAASGTVLARARQLAAAHAARLVVLHVIEADTPSWAEYAASHSESDLRDALRTQALAKVEALAGEADRPHRHDVRIAFGAPHEVITRMAGELSADLIVIGPGKRQSLKEKVLGSTADRVVRMARAPVLVVKNHVTEPYRRVAVAMDFSPQSLAAAQAAHNLAPAAKLTLVHVDEVPATFEQAMLSVGTSRAEMDAYRAARLAKARHDLAACAQKVPDLGHAATRHMQGVPGPVLVRLGRDGSIDLLALGPHGRGAALQALLGSVTQHVLREATCDVLIGPSPS